MKAITFTIFGEVKGKMRPKATAFGGHARVYTPSAQIKNENWIKMEYLKVAEKQRFDGFGDAPIKVEINHHVVIPESFSKKKRTQAIKKEIYPTKKPDADNLAKTVLDALNGVAFSDDKNIVELVITKDYSTKQYTSVYICEYPEEHYNPITNIPLGDDQLCLG